MLSLALLVRMECVRRRKGPRPEHLQPKSSPLSYTPPPDHSSRQCVGSRSIAERNRGGREPPWQETIRRNARITTMRVTRTAVAGRAAATVFHSSRGGTIDPPFRIESSAELLLIFYLRDQNRAPHQNGGGVESIEPALGEAVGDFLEQSAPSLT
jgi:hypothetical protein